ncbi:MAG TPA: hypothetical protein VMU19_12915 [Bryobacteraceae bacterium]|nr:hypothetical protein [Bryobacteraceae bacterium]
MNAFFRRAEEILEIATAEGASAEDKLLILDRQGGFRMIEPSGWSLPGAAAEFGAVAVYKVMRRGTAVRVEGWNGSERCLLQGLTGSQKTLNLLQFACCHQASMLHLAAPALA